MCHASGSGSKVPGPQARRRPLQASGASPGACGGRPREASQGGRSKPLGSLGRPVDWSSSLGFHRVCGNLMMSASTLAWRSRAASGDALPPLGSEPPCCSSPRVSSPPSSRLRHHPESLAARSGDRLPADGCARSPSCARHGSSGSWKSIDRLEGGVVRLLPLGSDWRSLPPEACRPTASSAGASLPQLCRGSQGGIQKPSSSARASPWAPEPKPLPWLWGSEPEDSHACSCR
mmetsp:Transcript_45858/g.146426  ORF Transcript_45858/g.146426 Transcript_45858/m.146426 type:complete len:233 (+) Transcript_45858:373-1071(+)